MAYAQTAFQLLIEIDQRCRLVAAGLPSQEAAQQTWSGIGFRMGEQHFVAPMGEVGEVLHEPRYTLLPGVKSWVKGVANVRGRLLPVMDLCGFFGLELSPLRKQRRILVVDYHETFTGLMVDEVFGMQHFPVEGYSEELPVDVAEHCAPAVTPFVQGVFQRERPWLVFSPHAVVVDTQFMSVVV